MREQAPLCRSPQHPTSNRDTMILVEETPSHYCFACIACKDINHVLSVQIRTKPEYARHVASDPQLVEYKRARAVEKKLGRITYFR